MKTSTASKHIIMTATPDGVSRKDWQQLIKGITPLVDYMPLNSTQPAGTRYSMFEMVITRGGQLRRFFTASLARELGILLTLSIMFPFLIHILPVPEDSGLGPRLLPMFYAPLLAALLGRTQSALIVALVAPWLNWALTMHPTPRGAVVATIQLLGFVVTLRALLPRIYQRWLLAVPAFFCGMMAAALGVAMFPGLVGGRSPVVWAYQSFVTGLPGLAILVLINWLAIRSYPTGPDGNGPLSI